MRTSLRALICVHVCVLMSVACGGADEDPDENNSTTLMEDMGALSGDMTSDDEDMGPSLVCGAGTVEVMGECVADLKTTVSSVALESFEVSFEDDKAYVGHPVTITGSVALDAPESFETFGVVMLEDDAGTRCIIGQVDLSYSSGEEAGAVQINEEFVVQQTCEGLVGSTTVQATLAFDPLEDTELEGRDVAAFDLENATTESLLEHLTQFTLETKSNTFGIEANPGADVELAQSALNTVVAVLDVDVEQTQAQTNDDIAQRQNAAGLPAPGADEIPEQEASKAESGTDPHFLSSVGVRVLGAGEDIDPTDISLAFRIRPQSGAPGTASLTEAEQEWAPLYTEIQEEAKAGEEVTVEYLLDKILNALVGPFETHLSSPVFITGESEEHITRGAWAGINQFELETCVQATFDEAEFNGEARANNCSVAPVVILRREINADGPIATGTETAAAAGEAIRAFNREWVQTPSGFQSSLGAHLTLNTGVKNNTATTPIDLIGSSIGPGAAAWANGVGYMTIGGQLAAIAQLLALDTVGDTADVVQGGINVLGIILFSGVAVVPDGEYTLDDAINLINDTQGTDYASEKSWEGTLIKGRYITRAGMFDYEAKWFITIGIDPEETKVAKQPYNKAATCTNSEPRSGDYCFVGVAGWANPDTARARCADIGGELAKVVDWSTDVPQMRAAAISGNWFIFGVTQRQTNGVREGIVSCGADGCAAPANVPNPIYLGNYTAPTQMYAHLPPSGGTEPWLLGPEYWAPSTMCRVRIQNAETGSSLSVTIEPHLTAGAKGTVDYWGIGSIVGLSVGIEGTLNMIRFAVPASAALRTNFSLPVSTRLVYGVKATLTFLSGDLKVNWSALFGAVDGDFQLFSWDGFTSSWDLVPETTVDLLTQ